MSEEQATSDGQAELDAEEEIADAGLSGEEALVACADLLYQRMQADPQIESHFQGVDLPQLAASLHRLLGCLFEGQEWPTVEVSAGLIEDCYADFQGVLQEALDKNEGLLKSLDILADEMVEDERLQSFFKHIQAAAATGDDEGEEGEDWEEDGANAQGEGEGNGLTDLSQSGGVSSGKDINVNALDDLEIEEQLVHASQDAWRLFLSTAQSREAAGEAIYAALFDSAPSLQNLFTTPRAVQAMRFMSGLASFIEALNDPPKLKILVETLGFGHLHLDVTPPRVVIFRDAILDLFMVELGERFTTPASEGWRRLLNYVGGAIIYVKTNYAGRVNTLLKSWQQCNHGATDEKDKAGMGSSSGEQDRIAMTQNKEAPKAKAKKNYNFFGGPKKKAGGGDAGAGATGDAKGDGSHKIKGNDMTQGAQVIPTTYPEMFMFNAAVMGFGQNQWLSEVLACFDNIVTNVSNSARLQEECDILALRIAKVTSSNVNLGEYKSCMLASLRSLLPKDWDSAHEVAWTWLWENVERLVLRISGKPPLWEKSLGKFLEGLDEDAKYSIRKDIYNTAFTMAPAIQDYFKQSNTYLHIIADKILEMTIDIYRNPVKMVDDISALGLRHVGYGIPIELFGPFVTACVEVMMTRTQDESTIESFRWSLGLVSKMLTRTIQEGSTIVMKAVTANSVKQMKKAIACAPRGQRADWMLTVQVGTQSISPFAWSVESGNLDAAVAIIRDLLTFRADRERYYFGVEELFKRHPDAIKILCDQAPAIIPKMLDGLIWRARVTEGGLRRVNYYVKHLIIDEAGNFSKALMWISDTRDAKLVCHPVIVLVSDIVWGKVAYITFLYGKSWLLFSLLVFVISQSVLEHAHDGEKNREERIAVFVGRIFIYCLSMTQLIGKHTKDAVKAYRHKNTFTIFNFIKIPNYLSQWQECANFFLTLSLIGMLCFEPVFWCMDHYEDPNGKDFEHDFEFRGSCAERENLRFTYTVFVMLVMFLYYILLLDLAVISTRISAFVLVCLRMLSEVCLFLGALASCILTFSSMLSVVKQDLGDFHGIEKGAYSLFRMVVGAYSPDRYARFRSEPTVLIVVIVFGITTVVFLMNMLIAQLSCAYSSVYEDMVGFARLDRAATIVEIVPSIPKKRWEKFVSSLRLNKRMEFNAGDIGVAGGIQVKEAASLNPTTIDMIKRFGGSTSAEVQWPEDEADGDGDDRLERMEKLIQKTLQRISKSHRSRRGGGGTDTGTGSGTGTKQSSSMKSDESHYENSDEDQAHE